MAAHRSHSRKKPIFTISRYWVLGAVGVVALGSLFYYLTTLGPKRVGQTLTEIKVADDSAVLRLSDEVAELERQYRLSADANLFTPEANAVLVKAVEKQKELMRTFSNAGVDQSSRLARLETELDGVRGREKVTVIDRLTADGEDQIKAGKLAEAGGLLREALRLQKEVNASSASSRYKNYVRETALTQAIASVEAAPMRREMEASLATAQKAAAEQRWDDALRAYTATRDIQVRINREYGRTSYADLAEVDRLNAEIESLNASGIATEIVTKEKAGDEAMALGKGTDAAALFAEAGALQLRVNKEYSRSRFVSSQLIERLEIKRQTALAAELSATITTLDREIMAHLAKRQVVSAAQKIGQMVGDVEKLFTDYPKSSRLDEKLRLKYAYLSLRKNDIRVLQDAVYERLLPLPGEAQRQMLATEVPQSLYAAVMTTNPSRNPGRSFPVDSVSWTDAQDFNARLSWLLGRSVRLPTQAEFRVALGEMTSEGWHSQNSGGRSHAADRKTTNGNGFSDLLGNLAEWMDTNTDAERAGVFGGSYLDRPETLLKAPVELHMKHDRARHIGLRIMVD